MYGLDAISAQNGWAMAFAGALIVISGLAVLSFVISQLYRVVALFEKPDKSSAEPASRVKEAPAGSAPRRAALDIDAARETYQVLVEELDEPFDLHELYALAKAQNLPHVHLMIRSLREAGILVPVGDGTFKWHGSAPIHG